MNLCSTCMVAEELRLYVGYDGTIWGCKDCALLRSDHYLGPVKIDEINTHLAKENKELARQLRDALKIVDEKSMEINHINERLHRMRVGA